MEVAYQKLSPLSRQASSAIRIPSETPRAAGVYPPRVPRLLASSRGRFPCSLQTACPAIPFAVRLLSVSYDSFFRSMPPHSAPLQNPAHRRIAKKAGARMRPPRPSAFHAEKVPAACSSYEVSGFQVMFRNPLGCLDAAIQSERTAQSRRQSLHSRETAGMRRAQAGPVLSSVGMTAVASVRF